MNSKVFCRSFIARLIRNQSKSLNSPKSRNFSVTKGKQMRYVQFKHKNGGVQRLGAQIAPEGDIFDISAVDSTIPNNLVQFLKAGTDVQQKAKR